MSESDLKVSLITVCYNSADTIKDTIESVLSQSYKNIEYIVVDGGSCDATLSIVGEYSERIATVISKPDKGIYDAMNRGIDASTGDVIGILNSDDIFENTEALKDLISAFTSEVDAVFADLIYVDRNDLKKPTRLYSSKGFRLWKMRFGFMVPHPTFYARKECFQKYGKYRLGYRVAADFELMARFFVAGVRFKRIDRVVVAMREGGISSGALIWRVHQNIEIARACRENGIKSYAPFMLMKLPFKILSFFKV